MGNKGTQIDLIKLAFYILQRAWLLVICAVIGFVSMYWYAENRLPDTYTASGTMYVYNGNPNLVNYQYASTSDIMSAVRLIDTYTVVVKSQKVLDVVAERLLPEYPNITPGFISGTLSMGSVSETGVVRVRCVTGNPKMSADICNAVLDVAPSEIIRVVGAGSIEIIDYATAPTRPDGRASKSRGMRGALIGAVIAGAFLTLLFLINRKITDTKDLTDNYAPPVLASIPRSKQESADPGAFLLDEKSPMEMLESYAKLRMNLLYTLVGKDNHVVVITSAISGEGKSTIAANLSISCARGGKKVLLIDGDLRRATQREIFAYDKKLPGLSEVLVGSCAWEKAILTTTWDMLNILPAGRLPPNPAELLGSKEMEKLLVELAREYDLILVDAPPVNIVSDALALSANVAGCLFLARQNYSDQRDVRKALLAAEMTGMTVLGFAFYGENINQGTYYSRGYYRKYYKSYYNKYDNRRHSTSEIRRSRKSRIGKSSKER